MRAVLGALLVLGVAATLATPAGATERGQGFSCIRCDPILQGGTGLDADQRRARAPCAPPPGHPDKVARCGKVARTGLLSTSCSGMHDHRAAGTIRPTFSSWPTQDGWVYGGERLFVCCRPTRR